VPNRSGNIHIGIEWICIVRAVMGCGWQSVLE
jgi:hypothetical protein